MAGDSNTRETMNALEHQFVRRNFAVALAWPPKHLTQINRLRPFKDGAGRAQIGCQTKFFDQERLLVHNGSRACVWLSLRFLLHQGEAVRLLPSTWRRGSASTGPCATTRSGSRAETRGTSGAVLSMWAGPRMTPPPRLGLGLGLGLGQPYP